MASASINTVDSRKLRGGYYTPPVLAQFLVNWGMSANTKRVLEPSCGDGNFVAAIVSCLAQNPTWSPDVVAVEMQVGEMYKAQLRAGRQSQQIKWIAGDFFAVYPELKKQAGYDLIIGNPPFIHFHRFDKNSRDLAYTHLHEAGYKPTRLANAWAAFVQLGIEMLNKNGRLAMVVPAELLQVKYAEELRNRLGQQFRRVTLVTFKQTVFPEIQQEVVLLLAEGKTMVADGHTAIRVIELSGASDLKNLDVGHTIHSSGNRPVSDQVWPGIKWASCHLGGATLTAVNEALKSPGLVRFGQVARVNLGIITGHNQFFVLSKAQRDFLQAGEFVIPAIGRTSSMKPVIFTKEDFSLYAQQYPAYLLKLNGIPATALPETLRDYLSAGESEGVHLRYKCRIRPRWFDLPPFYVSDMFLSRQAHLHPHLMMNEAGAATTNALSVRVNQGIDGRLLAAIFANSLTLTLAEMCGRSYGGGVLEITPFEAGQLPLPCTQGGLAVDVEKVDRLLRNGRAAEALDYVDRAILMDGLGFSPNLVRHIRDAGKQLRERRMRGAKKPLLRP